MAVPCPLHDDIQSYLDHRKFLVPNAPNSYTDNLINYFFYRHVPTDYETPILTDLQDLGCDESSGGVPSVLSDYADDIEAELNGIEVGEEYHTSGIVKIRLS